MKSTSYFFYSLLLWAGSLSGQGLTIDPDYDAQRLVREVFASGECETIFNIEQIGSNPESIGFFSGPDSIVGFHRGIIISTGRVVDATGPNEDTNTGVDLSGPTPDPDLDLAATATIYDRSGLEFDFIPLQPRVTFRYVFASEEYCEFVGREFNDIFGFFISGPGLSGPFADDAINLALVPGTDEAVSINNINFARNASFYRDNENPAVRSLSNCGGGSSVGPLYQLIEYDGQTTILTASIELQTCATYHIRLLVGDVEDGGLDSAVFLEAGSFDLGGSVSFTDENGDSTRTTIFEGCEATSFRVQRGPQSNPDRDQTINYRIGNNSIAQEGSDFTAGSGSITIPAGSDFAEIPIQAFADGITEGPENAWLYLDIPCACYTDSIELIIDEPAALNVGLQEAYYCPDQTVTLRPSVTGGAPPYQYQWSFGSTDSTPTLSPPLPPSIELVVSDACGQQTQRSIPTFSSVPPSLSFPPQDLISCLGEDQNIVFDLTGNTPITVTYQLNNGPLERWAFTGTGRQAQPINRGGNYRIIAVEDQACRTAVNETLRADFYDPAINPRLESPSCAGRSDGSIAVTHLPTVGPYVYEWEGISPDSLSASNLSAGVYGITVTDALGCRDERTLPLLDPDPITPVEISCNEVRRPPLMPSAGGGRPPYRYSVDGVNYFGREGFDRLNEGEFYTLRIEDAVGCSINQPNFFWPKATRRPVRMPSFVPQEIAGSAAVEPEYFVPPDQIVTYRWSPAELFDCAACPMPTVSARNSTPVSLVVENIYGCVDSLVTFVALDGRVPLFVPNIFTPNGDGVNDNVTAYANPDQVARIISFRVFSRWGDLLFEEFDYAPNDSRVGWNGLLNGQIAGVGTYIWTAEIELTTGERQQETGTVVLMR